MYWARYVLRANIMHVTREYKADEGVLSYSRLTNWCLAPPWEVVKADTMEMGMEMEMETETEMEMEMQMQTHLQCRSCSQY